LNRKLLGVFAVALIAIVGGSAAWTMTWTSAKVTMTAGTACVTSLGIFQDCACTVPFTSHNWDGVVQDQIYEVTAYVRNTGNQAVYITYTPGSLSFDGAQTRFRINVTVIEGPAMPCQLLTNYYKLPLKNPLVCENGFLLTPGKVVKIDIELVPDSLVAGGSWSWNFFIEGCAP
jgi:hypothetical protein